MSLHFVLALLSASFHYTYSSFFHNCDLSTHKCWMPEDKYCGFWPAWELYVDKEADRETTKNKIGMKGGKGCTAYEQEVEKMKCNKGSVFKGKSIWRHL